MKYNCNICGKKHDLYFGIKAEMSQNINKILEDTPERVIEFDGLYLVDKLKVVLPAQLTLRTEYNEDFFYQTWVECEVKEFIKFSEEFKNGKGGNINGNLLDDLLPYFPDTRKLKCLVKFKENLKSSEYPIIQITEESELKSLQENKITKAEFDMLMSRVHHS